MKVIIVKTGETKEVSLGYAVNFLLPKKLAVVATKKRQQQLEKELKQKQQLDKESKLKDRQKAEQLDGKVIEIKVKAGKSGKVHGSVTKKEIAKFLKVLKTEVVIDKPIKKVGEYEVGLKFGKSRAKVKLILKAE